MASILPEENSVFHKNELSLEMDTLLSQIQLPIWNNMAIAGNHSNGICDCKLKTRIGKRFGPAWPFCQR